MVQFIDHESELEEILSHINDWGTRQAIFVQGQGGVGKTRLMQEIQHRMSDVFVPMSEYQYNLRPIKIMVAMLYADTVWGRQYWQGCQAMAKGLGIEIFLIDGENSPDSLAERMEEHLGEKPDAIILDRGIGEKVQAVVNKAINQKIRIVTSASNVKNDELVYVEQNEKELAKTSFEQLLADIGSSGKVVTCCHPGLAVLDERLQVVREMLLKAPNVSTQWVSYRKPGIPEGKFAENEIAIEVKKVIKETPDIKAIWASTAGYGLGALQALKELRRNDILLYSIDFSQEILEKMLEPDSPWIHVVASNPAEVGRIMVRIAFRIIHGEKTKTFYNLPKVGIHQKLLRSLSSDGILELANIAPWGRSSYVGWTPALYRLVVGKGNHTDIPPWHSNLLKENKAKQGEIWLILNMLDMDDIRIQSPHDLSLRIIEQIGAEHFQEYFGAIKKVHSLSPAVVEKSEQFRSEAEDIFIDTLNNFSLNHRTVIFCDTTDAIKTYYGEQALTYLIEIAARIDNCVLVVSGRDADKYAEKLVNSTEVNLHVINLDILKEEDSREYFIKKQQALNLTLNLDDSSVEELLLLSNGLPILIDLAVEWFSQFMPQNWRSNLPVNDLRALPQDKLKQKRHDFEEKLVSNIIELRDPLNHLILALARIYPMDEELAAALIKIKVAKVKPLIADAKKLAFVKTLPDGSIKLHDYMQEMVKEHVWPIFEDEGRDKSDSKRAAEYFDKKYQKLKQKIENGLADSLEQESLLVEFWQAGANLVYHTLVVNPKEGSELFHRLFQEAGQKYWYSARRFLVETIKPYFDAGKLVGSEKVLFGLDFIEFLIYSGQYERGRDVGMELLKDGEYSSEQYTTILTRVANCNLRLGFAADSAQEYQMAIDYCQEREEFHNLLPKLNNFLGQVYRQMGQVSTALEYYDKGLKLTKDRRTRASLYNNIGYVYALQGEYEAALAQCENGLAIREDLGDKRELAMSYTTRGIIYRDMGNYAVALANYNLALSIFEPEDDVLWLARLYTYRGALYRLMGKYSAAHSDLGQSIKYRLPSELTFAYHVLGCVFWDQRQYPAALNYVEESYRHALELGDTPMLVNNIVVDAEIYHEQWIAESRHNSDAPARISQKATALNELVGNGFPHHTGRMLKVLADLSYEQGDYERSLLLYAQAFTNLSGRAAGYGRRTFQDERKELEQRIVEDLAVKNLKLAENWVDYLRDYFEKTNISQRQKIILTSFCDRCSDLLSKPGS